MKALKWILITIGGLVVLVLVVGLFLPSSFRISRSVEINKPVEVVFPYVADFHHWLEWSAWSEMEPGAKNSFTGEAAQVGSSWTWEGDTLGVGSLTIDQIVPNQQIISKLVFIAPQKSEGQDEWAFTSTPNGTKVIWTISGHLDYLINRYVGLIMEGSILGPTMEKGLQNLKRVTEALPEQEAITEKLDDEPQ